MYTSTLNILTNNTQLKSNIHNRYNTKNGEYFGIKKKGMLN